VDLQQRQVNCDLDLICKNGLTVKCHRLIMGQEIALYLCQQPPGQPHSYYLVLDQFSANIVEVFVKYCYTGIVDFCVDELPQLTSLCHFVKSKSLADLAKNFLLENINVLTLSQIKQLDFQSMKYVILEGQFEFVDFSRIISAWMKQDPAGKEHEYVQLMENLHLFDNQAKKKLIHKDKMVDQTMRPQKKTQKETLGARQMRISEPLPSANQSRRIWK